MGNNETMQVSSERVSNSIISDQSNHIEGRSKPYQIGNGSDSVMYISWEEKLTKHNS